MDNVINWIFVVSEQEAYHDYLVRRPYRAPENATLALELKKTLTAQQSLEDALAIAAAFSAFYGIDLYWSGIGLEHLQLNMEPMFTNSLVE